MIFPNKNLLLSSSLLGFGFIILNNLKTKETVSSLWSKVRGEKINTFEKFILVLDFLFMLNIVDINDGLISQIND